MEALLDVFPDTQPIYEAKFFSPNYQPDKVLVTSFSDIEYIISKDAQPENFFNSFRIRLQRPALHVKGIELTRASIPNPLTNIPDSETTFWYFRIPAANLGDPDIFTNGQYLHYVRLLPSYYKPEFIVDNSGNIKYGINRTFVDYEDLLTELNKACLHDLLDNSLTYGTNYTHISGDITFYYNQTNNKFQMVGADPNYFYISAGFEIPLLQTAQAYLFTLSNQQDLFPIQGVPGQPFTPQRTLNMRLGFTWDGTNTQIVFKNTNATNVSIGLINRFRPIPAYSQDVSGSFTATPTFNSMTYTAESYANLVNTNCVNIFLDNIGNSSLDSVRDNNLLASVPMNCGNLGVTFYTPAISTPMTKLQNKEIYELYFTMFDDVGNPFWLSQGSAILSLELKLTYE
jgi:hypothetical protein